MQPKKKKEIAPYNGMIKESEKTKRKNLRQVNFKANMSSYIQLQTAAIFFLSSLYLKPGIDSVYVMVGFICKG